MNRISKAILFSFIAVVISCAPEVKPDFSIPTVSESKAEVTNTTQYVTLSASIEKPHQVSEAGFYISEDASMSSVEKIVVAKVSDKISAKYLPGSYGKTYYYKAFISNGWDERLSERRSFKTENFDYYVNLSSSIESMTETTATVSASLTVAKGISITSKGFCYGDKENVTIEDNVIEVTSSAFTAEIPCEKQTYVRAYVKDGSAILYTSVLSAIIVESLTLDKESIDMFAGESITLKATVLPTTATLSTPSWKSSDTKVATVNNGKVTAVGNGTATITATCNGKSATCIVNVTTKSTGIQLNKTSLSLNVGASETLTATVLPATTTDKTVTWSSSNEKVATVTDSKVTAIGIGTATITAKNGTNTATCKVDVIIPVTSVSLNKTEISLNAGESETLTATVLPETATDKTVTWSSSNENVATVTNGKVIAVGNGTATTTATCNGKSATCTVTVTTKSTSVKLNKTSLSMEIGDSETLTATVLPATTTDKTVTWSSSNENVATVTDGKVTAVSIGSTTITAKNGTNTATCKVDVIIPVTSISLNKSELSLNIGDSETLTIIILPETATNKSVTWSSSNTSVATVSSSGLVSARAKGTATITVTTVEGGKTAECVVNVDYEYVDLGLSVKWATCNVGASKPEEYGGYYQWAGTKDVTSTSIYLDWDNCPYHTGSNEYSGWTKYNRISSYGRVDNKTILQSSDDAAHVNWGGSWRMPTDEEWTELRENCIWTWTTQNGIYGYKVTSKKTGYTSNSIFLPAAGHRIGGSLFDAGSHGEYWSSSVKTDATCRAWKVCFGLDKISRVFTSRCCGNSVRPVSD